MVRAGSSTFRCYISVRLGIAGIFKTPRTVLYEDLEPGLGLYDIWQWFAVHAKAIVGQQYAADVAGFLEQHRETLLA